MARKPVIFGNWKMNKTPSEAEEFMKGIEAVLTGNEAADYGIGAPYVDLDVCVKNAKNLLIAAENCNEKDSGAYTGEVSVPMLKEVGITYCIIGGLSYPLAIPYVGPKRAFDPGSIAPIMN